MNDFNARCKGQPLTNNDTVKIRLASNVVEGEVYQIEGEGWYLIKKLGSDDAAIDYHRPDSQAVTASKDVTVKLYRKGSKPADKADGAKLFRE